MRESQFHLTTYDEYIKTTKKGDFIMAEFVAESTGAGFGNWGFIIFLIFILIIFGVGFWGGFV